MEDRVNFEDFAQEDFGFAGNYRAIVEDNEDPIDVGRVRVRIFGMHSPDESITPTSHLPWAEPCLAVYFSGGQNLGNDKNKPTKELRYTPDGAKGDFPSRKSEDLSKGAIYEDSVMRNEGSGGIFTVPQKGSQVWIFFENGDHTRPQYWSIASKKADWDKQKIKLETEIKNKQENVKNWQDIFEDSVDKDNHVGKSVSENAKL